MAMTPEAKVKKRIKSLLDANKVYYHMTVTGGFGKSGTPDFLCCHKGRFFSIEAKAGTAVTLLQELAMDKIREAGGTAFVVRTHNDVEEGWVELKQYLELP